MPFCPLWAFTFLFVRSFVCLFSFLIVLYFSISHYFTIILFLLWFVFVALLANCDRKASNKCLANCIFVQTSKFEEVLFCSWAHVLITFHVWTHGGTHTRFSVCDRQIMWKNARNMLTDWIQLRVTLSLHNAHFKSKERFVWLSNLWLCRNDTQFTLQFQSYLFHETWARSMQCAFKNYWTNFTLIFFVSTIEWVPCPLCIFFLAKQNVVYFKSPFFCWFQSDIQ